MLHDNDKLVRISTTCVWVIIITAITRANVMRDTDLYLCFYITLMYVIRILYYTYYRVRYVPF